MTWERRRSTWPISGGSGPVTPKAASGPYLMRGFRTSSDAPLYYGIQTRIDGSKAL